MNKALMLFGILLILLIVELNGCVENSSKLDEDRIIGTWIGSDIFQGVIRNITMIFFSNKTFKTIATFESDMITGNGNWSIINNKLFIDITEPNISKSKSDYKFSNNFNILTIIDSTGKSIDFTKQ